MKNKTLCMLSSALICSIMLTGCGKSKYDYDAYKKEVNELYDSIAIANTKLNEIQIYSEESRDEFFEDISNLKSAFDDFSQIEAPTEFKNCTELAKNAYSLLNESEDYFHDALDGEYDEESYLNGVNHFNEVVTCVNYMGMILQGKEIETESNS